MKIWWLSDFDGRRDNNFTLLRLVFATVVLYAHSYALTRSGINPINQLIAPYAAIQSIAVDGFFIISGFLVTASLINRGIIQYAIRRTLRIFPGFWVCLFITVAIIGPLVTNLSTSEYFSHPLTFQHIKRSYYIFNGVQGKIPGAFLERGIYSEALNGSLWTLPAEIRCYILLAILWVFSKPFGKYGLSLLILSIMILGMVDYDKVPFLGITNRFSRLGVCFALGSLVWIYRDRIPLVWPLAIASIFSPFLLAGTPIFYPSLYICLAYLTFYAAFSIPHLDLDRFGDISFGVYIYAWPVQQAIMWPGQNGLTNAVLAILIVFPIATASWFLVEKPSLRLLRLKLRKEIIVSNEMQH